MRSRVGIAVVIAMAGAAGSLRAQASDAMYARLAVVSGWETRGLTFVPDISTNLLWTTRSVWQWDVPVAVIAPLGRRMSFDLTTYFANGQLQTFSGTQETLSGLTDTQLRLLYTASRDRLVGSIALNLPTGDHSIPLDRFGVAGAIGSNFLSFPVSNFGTAFGVTGGVAYAQHAGAWNLGLSGSARYVATYSPFEGDSLSYTPGIEVRFRGGADRLLGAHTRMLLGFTVSTFSTDTYSGSNALITGSYGPGTRFIGDLTMLRVIGRSTLTLTAWDLYRLAGSGSTGLNPDTKENVLNAELRLSHPVGRLAIEPLVALRQWNPADYLGGRFGSGGLSIRAGVTQALSLTATGRYDRGWIYDRIAGRANLQGFGASVFLRVER